MEKREYLSKAMKEMEDYSSRIYKYMSIESSLPVDMLHI